MKNKNDTIVALSTPPGTSGISVIRLSGTEAFSITDKIFVGKTKATEAKSHTIHYGKLIDHDRLIDTVTISIFREPNSYTGEDISEISCHGGMIVYEDIIKTLFKYGARPAEPGEYTKRAFLNGKLDLVQVEAVSDIIHSVSTKGAQTAARQLAGEFTNRLAILRHQLMDICSLLELELDFSDEDIEFVDKGDIKNRIIEVINYCDSLSDAFRSSEILRSGFYVGIAGYPNSGKSTLFNSLLQKNRAIVSEIPGTTRDYLEEIIYLNGIPVKLIDTAGIRESSDIIEIEGIRFVESIIEQSNLVLILNDLTESKNKSDNLLHELKTRFPATKLVLVHNKIDSSIDNEFDENDICISAKNGTGIERLKILLESEAVSSTDRVNDILINQRHFDLLSLARLELNHALLALESSMENELISIDIRKATKILGEITGETWSEDILNNIFAGFCIGK